MEIEQAKQIIEAVLFASARTIRKMEFAEILDLSIQDVATIVENLKQEMQDQKRPLEIISLQDGYELCTKPEYYEYIYPLMDNRSKPNLSTAALETLSIIAYNPKITRAEIEQIRGVNSDGTIYRLLEYNLIEETGKLDIPGKPVGFRTSEDFLKKFGLSSLEELPELPKYKVDENEQIVIEDMMEAPEPERDVNEE